MSTDCQINIDVNLDLSPVNVAAQLALFNVGSFGVLSINGADGVVILNLADINDTSVTGAQLDADNAKLALIEALADVTDAANVKAAIPAAGGYLTTTALTSSTGAINHDMSLYAKSTLLVDDDGGTITFTNIVVGKPGTVRITRGSDNDSLNLDSKLNLQGDMADIAAGSSGDFWLLSFEFTSSTTGVATLLPAQ